MILEASGAGGAAMVEGVWGVGEGLPGGGSLEFDGREAGRGVREAGRGDCVGVQGPGVRGGRVEGESGVGEGVCL